MKRAAGLLALLLYALSGVAADHPTAARGFSPEKVYHFQGVDSVSLFNGNLNITLPIGGRYPADGGRDYGITLTYNSKLWTFATLEHPVTGLPYITAEPVAGNAGLGWSIGPGVLGYQEYLDATGSTHTFLPRLHDESVFYSCTWQGAICLQTSDPFSIRDVRYTADGSLLRMTYYKNGSYLLESGDGEKRTFDASGRLTKVSDQYGELYTVSYAITNGAVDSYTIHDKHDRTQTVQFKTGYSGDPVFKRLLDKIVLTAPADANGAARTATYEFTYTDVVIPRDCRHEKIEDDPGTAMVPLLTMIRQKELDWSYRFEYEQTGSTCTPGVLKVMTLPTLGRYEWSYSGRDGNAIPIPACGDRPLTNDTPGVTEKREYAYGSTTASASWQYSAPLVAGYENKPKCNNDPNGFETVGKEMKRSVTTPDGHRTDHYFTVWTHPLTGSDGSTKADYGLPFVRRAQDAETGAYLSREDYDCQGSCVLKRTHFVLYEGANDFHPRVKTSVAVHHEPAGDQRVVTVSDSYDGYGNYRQSSVSSTIGGPERTTFTRYNDGAGANGRAADQNQLQIDYNFPWFLGRFDRRTVRDSNGQNAVSDYCFSFSGSLVGQRVYKDAGGGSTAATVAPNPSTSDSVTLFEHDAAGNVIAERSYGGDRTPLAFSGLCFPAAQTPEYETAYGYSHGVRVSEQRSGMVWKSLDLTADAKSGLARTSRLPDGILQTFDYDVTGQLLSVTSDDPHVNVTDPATTSYTYTNASPKSGTANDGVPDTAAAPARVRVTRGDTESEVLFDWFGRVWREKKRMPSGSWSVRETLYDGQWRNASLSEWATLVIPSRPPGAPADQPNPTELDFVLPYKTTSLYDGSGRLVRVTAPDGSVSAAAYVGISEVRRTAKVATDWGAPAPPSPDAEIDVTRQELRDGLGRLVSVTEGFDAANADAPSALTTAYEYDIGDRLTKVSMENPGGSAQERFFTYDRRGFLLGEQHPELGAGGHGTTAYFDYDSRGHPWRKQTGAAGGSFDLRMTFDKAERLTKVERMRSNPACPPPHNGCEAYLGEAVKELLYDGLDTETYTECVAGRCHGKLVATRRFNSDPDLSPAAGDHAGRLAVNESFQYNGVGGAPSRHDVIVENVPGRLAGTGFHVTQTYTALGDVATTSYPCRTIEGNCDPADPSRTVTYTRSRGLLASVGDGSATYASSFSYAPNGMATSIVHGSLPAVTESWTPDPHGLARPKRIQLVAGGTTLWDTGDYAYDDDGNIKSIGNTDYRYDPYRRLVRWQVNGPDGSFSSTGRGYDPFGNFLFSTMKGCGPVPAEGARRCLTTSVAGLRVSGTSNHYADAVYDDAGNQTRDVDGGEYTFDSASMIRRAVVGGRDYRFLYNARDERVGVVERVAGQNRATWTLRGFENQLLRSWTDDATSGTRVVTWKEDEIFRGSQVLASVTPSGARHYALDHLGSPRYVQAPGGSPSGPQEFAPFGGGGALEAGVLQFTGHERDAAAVGGGDIRLPDYMHARFYDAGMGRFLSVDPVLDIEKLMHEPQLWNRHAYVTNNPLRYTDPDGRDRYQEPGFTKPLSDADWSDAPPVIKVAFSIQGALLGEAAGEVFWGCAAGAVGRVVGRLLGRADNAVDAARTVNRAYEAAAQGGKHSGTLRNYIGRPAAEIARGVRGHEKQVALHLDKIANPAKHVKNWANLTQKHQQALVRDWHNDIRRNQEMADVLRGLLDGM